MQVITKIHEIFKSIKKTKMFVPAMNKTDIKKMYIFLNEYNINFRHYLVRFSSVTQYH